jgi:hypothetical protein
MKVLMFSVPFCIGWKTTSLTSIFFAQTSVFLASWYHGEGVDTDIADVDTDVRRC